MRAVIISVFLLLSFAGRGFVSSLPNDLPMTHVVLKVLDDDGRPVVNARVRGGLMTGDGLNDYTCSAGFTDGRGEYVIRGRVRYRLHFHVSKVGFYSSENDMFYHGAKVVDGKWMPYGTVRIVVLKQIRNLGRHVVFPDNRRKGTWIKPRMNEWIGFDFEAYDWVKPFGKGMSNDVLIRFRTFERNRLTDWRHEMDVSFTNNPFGGAYVVKKSQDSRLRWNHIADTNADFKSSFSFFIERSQRPFPTRNLLDGDSCLVFRTRTTVDKGGHLIKAHYGVLAGEWLVGKTCMKLSDSCFNLTPNDPDVEDGFFLRRQVKSDLSLENSVNESSP